MGFGLVNAQPLHEPAILLRSQGSGLTFLPGPLEGTGLQTLVQQNKSVAFPIQCFDSVPASAAKKEQCIGKRIQIELLLNQRCQSVYPLAQVCIPAGNIHTLGAAEIAQHDFRMRSTISTVAASAPEWISASAPLRRTVTATLLQRTGCAGVTSAN